MNTIQDPNAATVQIINKIKHYIEMAKTMKKDKNKVEMLDHKIYYKIM